MFIDDYLPLNHLLAWLDELSPKLESKYKIRTTLIPSWNNFLSLQVDCFDFYPGKWSPMAARMFVTSWLWP